MNAYEKSRDLIQRIESHRVEIESHHKMIGQLQRELRSAMQEADLQLSNETGAPPAKTPVPSAAPVVARSHKKKVVAPAAKAKTPVPSAVPVAARSHKKKVIAPPKPAAVQPAKRTPPKSGSYRNGQKSQALTDKPTLGDLVRTVIMKAGRPLKRLEIQAGLQELKYSNSTSNPYKTLGVRLHRLESRGVVSVGNSQFDVTPQWRQRHARLIQAAEKKAAKEAAEAPAAPATAAVQ
jgi:hypothetical protein